MTYRIAWYSQNICVFGGLQWLSWTGIFNILPCTGVHTSLPFPHRIVAGSITSDPYILIAGPGIHSEEDGLYLEMREAGNLYIGVQRVTNSSFEQPLQIMLRWLSHSSYFDLNNIKQSMLRMALEPYPAVELDIQYVPFV